MRRLVFALTLIAAIPALVLPLLTFVAALAAPAALIAGIAAVSLPVEGSRNAGRSVEVLLARSGPN